MSPREIVVLAVYVASAWLVGGVLTVGYLVRAGKVTQADIGPKLTAIVRYWPRLWLDAALIFLCRFILWAFRKRQRPALPAIVDKP